MIREQCPVVSVSEMAREIFLLRFASAAIGSSTQPGQFVNIKTGDGLLPLLRRPFSVYRVDPPHVDILFNVVGRGTALLRDIRKGGVLDIEGPLGRPFTVAGSDFETAILVGGGLGVAPLPHLTMKLKANGKSVRTFVGSRHADLLVLDYLENVSVATDDGSRGERGTVVDLAQKELATRKHASPRLYGCGPTPMLKALARMARELNMPCEVSLEGPMACGVGICQGCPVELAGSDRKYGLMCKDGPVFDIDSILL
jgi:dihydroorotate dehydrogenase electron transfer subunit